MFWPYLQKPQINEIKMINVPFLFCGGEFFSATKNIRKRRAEETLNLTENFAIRSLTSDLAFDRTLDSIDFSSSSSLHHQVIILSCFVLFSAELSSDRSYTVRFSVIDLIESVVCSSVFEGSINWWQILGFLDLNDKGRVLITLQTSVFCDIQFNWLSIVVSEYWFYLKLESLSIS